MAKSFLCIELLVPPHAKLFREHLPPFLNKRKIPNRLQRRSGYISSIMMLSVPNFAGESTTSSAGIHI